MPVLNPPALFEERVEALANAHKDAGLAKAELDLSGGIDSAVMACLLVKALNPENVVLVHSGINTDPKQTERAVRLATALRAPLVNLDLGPVFTRLLDDISLSMVAAGISRDAITQRVEADRTIVGSIRSTLRAPVGRGINRLFGGGLRHGTGNEDEDRWLRFYQKGGDGEVDSNPLAMLSKGEVYQLAVECGRQLGPEVQAAMRPIIEALPSPDLWGVGDQHSDEDELKSWLKAPFTYSRVNPDTGEYVSVGTIERVSRFLDTYPIDLLWSGDKFPWDRIVDLAAPYFPGFDQQTVEALICGAQKAERATRHKMNPNIPTYGSRSALVDNGILTDELPNL